MKKQFISLLVLLILLMVPQQIYAAEPASSASNQDNSLTVNAYYGAGDKQTPIEGLPVTVLQIAGISKDSNQLSYTTLPPFSSIVADVNTITEKNIEEISNRLHALVFEKKLPGITQKTDKTGTAKFTNLKPGLYLVTQLETFKINGKYYTMQPFLISVPEYENQKWNYDVVANPKISETPTPPDSLVPTVPGGTIPNPGNPGNPDNSLNPGTSNNPGTTGNNTNNSTSTTPPTNSSSSNTSASSNERLYVYLLVAAGLWLAGLGIYTLKHKNR